LGTKEEEERASQASVSLPALDLEVRSITGAIAGAEGADAGA